MAVAGKKDWYIGDDWVMNFQHLDDNNAPIVITWDVGAIVIKPNGDQVQLDSDLCVVLDQTVPATKGCFKIKVPKTITQNLAGPLPPDYNPSRTYKETVIKIQLLYLIDGNQETQAIITVEAKRP